MDISGWVDWVGLKPVGGAMIAAALEMGILAIIATAGGIPVSPVSLTTVFGTWVILSAGHEAYRQVTMHAYKKRPSAEEHADAQRMLWVAQTTSLALKDPYFIVNDNGTLRVEQVQPSDLAMRQKYFADSRP